MTRIREAEELSLNSGVKSSLRPNHQHEVKFNLRLTAVDLTSQCLQNMPIFLCIPNEKKLTRNV